MILCTFKESSFKKIMSNNKSKIYNDLLTSYRLNLVEIEMKLYEARLIRGNNKIQRYFNSTPIRNAFARWMVYAAYKNQYFNITQLSKDLHTNRQTISSIIKDCEEEAYIIVKRIGKNTECKAAPILIEKMEDYCDWRRELSKDIWEALLLLNTFEKYLKE